MFNSENIIQRNLKHLSGKSIRLCAVATVLFVMCQSNMCTLNVDESAWMECVILYSNKCLVCLLFNMCNC